MIGRRSRYARTAVITVDDARSGTHPLLDLRVAPDTTAALQFTPTDSDRLDLLAWEFYRDPTRFWRICDATSQLDPFDVLAPGEPTPIPPDK